MSSHVAQPIVGRYEKINPRKPDDNLAGCVIYIVNTAKGTPRAVTSAGHLGIWDRNTEKWERNLTVGDRMVITLDTFTRGYRRLSWTPENIVGIVVVDNDGNITVDGDVPNRQIVRYFCD